MKTAICSRNAGSLNWFGHKLSDLRRSKQWAEVIGLFVYKRFPTAKELQRINLLLSHPHRELSEPEKQSLDTKRQLAISPTQMLQSMLAERKDLPNPGKEKSEFIVELMWDLVLYLSYFKNRDSVNTDGNLMEKYLENVLGRIPKDAEVLCFEKMLLSASDAGLNVSSMSIRIGAAARLGFYHSLSLAIGAWASDYHGNASCKVGELFNEIKSMRPGEIEKYLEEQYFAQGKRIFGIGHKVHKHGEDPRVDIAAALFRAIYPGQNKYLDLANEVARIAAMHNLYPNPELWVGVIFSQMGIPAEYMPVSILLGRCAGWYAHYLEQEQCRILDSGLMPQIEFVEPIEAPIID